MFEKYLSPANVKLLHMLNFKWFNADVVIEQQSIGCKQTHLVLKVLEVWRGVLWAHCFLVLFGANVLLPLEVLYKVIMELVRNSENFLSCWRQLSQVFVVLINPKGWRLT